VKVTRAIQMPPQLRFRQNAIDLSERPVASRWNIKSLELPLAIVKENPRTRSVYVDDYTLDTVGVSDTVRYTSVNGKQIFIGFVTKIDVSSARTLLEVKSFIPAIQVGIQDEHEVVLRSEENETIGPDRLLDKVVLYHESEYLSKYPRHQRYPYEETATAPDQNAVSVPPGTFYYWRKQVGGERRVGKLVPIIAPLEERSPVPMMQKARFAYIMKRKARKKHSHKYPAARYIRYIKSDDGGKPEAVKGRLKWTTIPNMPSKSRTNMQTLAWHFAFT
jgi:hypothetical protein